MPMTVLGLVGVLVVLGALVVLMKVMGEGEGPGEKGKDELKYDAAGALLTEAELAFYRVLVDAADAGHAGSLVMCKVRLGDLIRPRRGIDRSEATSLRNRANQKHIDFVIVDLGTLEPLVCVELDDASHARKDRQKRDAYVDAALAAAGGAAGACAGGSGVLCGEGCGGGLGGGVS